jgi:hypothetical protein
VIALFYVKGALEDLSKWRLVNTSDFALQFSVRFHSRATFLGSRKRTRFQFYNRRLFRRKGEQ